MKEKLLSIVVPVYGEDEFLDQCIESLVKQKYNNIEIILVDDGSPDHCPEICDKWADKDSRITVIHKKNGGLVSARKAGVRIANGDYIGYVDGDDWIDEDYFWNLMEQIIENDADIVSSGYCKELFGKSIACTNHITSGVYNREKLEQEVFPKMIFDKEISSGGICTYVWNKVFKKEIVLKNQLEVIDDIIIGEDSACVYPSILDSNRMVILDNIGYHYRQRMNSLLRGISVKPENVLKLKKFYDFFSLKMQERTIEFDLKEQIENFFIHQLIMMTDSLTEIYPELGKNFPFINLKQEDKIIIHSAGAFGIHLYNQYQKQHFNIVAWSDPDFEQYRGREEGVVSLQQALKQKFDVIVIASMDRRFINDVKEELKDLGINECMVHEISNCYDIIKEKLKNIGLLNE